MTDAFLLHQLLDGFFRFGKNSAEGFRLPKREPEIPLSSISTTGGIKVNSSIRQEDSLELARTTANKLSQPAVRLLDRGIFFALLTLIVLAAIPHGIVEQHWESVFECAVFALAGLWIIEGLLSGAWRVRGRELLWPLLAFSAFAFIQTLPIWGASTTAGIQAWRTISADPYETRLIAFKLVALTLMLGLLMRYTSSQFRLRALIYVVIGVAVASAIFGVVRETSQRASPDFISSYLEQGRGYAQFINRNHFALLMEMALGLTLGLVVAGGVRRDRLLFYLAAAVSMWTTLVLSNSRGGIFSMLAQLLFIALFFTAVRSRKGSLVSPESAPAWLRGLGSLFLVRITLVASLLIVVAVGILWVGGDSLVGRLEIVPGEVSAESAETRQGERRVEIWRATWQLIKDHPVTGIGFGGFATAIPKYHNASGELMPQQAHNDYLELLASGGIIGLALATWFVIAFIRKARRMLRSTNSFRRAACFGALTGIFGVAVHSLFDFGLHVTVNALVLESLLVIAVARPGDEWEGDTRSR